MIREHWSLRNVYLYLVCLITLVMCIVGVVNLVRSVVDLAYPQPVMAPVPIKEAVAPGGTTSPEETAAQQVYQDRWAIRSAVLSIVGNITMLLVAGPLYLYHWRKIERERAAATPA